MDSPPEAASATQPPPRARGPGYTLPVLIAALAVASALVAALVGTMARHDEQRRREDGRGALRELALLLEHGYASQGRYPRTLEAAGLPERSPAGLYALSLVAPRPDADAASYLLRAVPLGEQAGDPCGAYTYDERGQWTYNISGAAAALDCRVD